MERGCDRSSNQYQNTLLLCVPKLTDDGVIITRTKRFEGDGSNFSTVSIFGLTIERIVAEKPTEADVGSKSLVFFWRLVCRYKYPRASQQ